MQTIGIGEKSDKIKIYIDFMLLQKILLSLSLLYSIITLTN